MSFEQRTSAFSKPKTKAEIIRGRKQIHVNDFQDIVPALEQRRDNEVIVIGPAVVLIPDKFYSPTNFTKRGTYISLKTFGREESIELGWSPEKARISANLSLQEKSYNPDKRFVAWHWRDSNEINHVLEPWQVIEGRRIEMFGHLNGDSEDRTELKKGYSARDSNLIAIHGLVPSRSHNKKHTIILENLTRLDDETKHYEWARIASNHSCDLKSWADTTFGLRNPYRHCIHEIALHAAYSRKVGEKSRRIVHQPFPMITEPTLRLYLSLLHDTLKIDMYESGRVRTHPLGYIETNPIIMDAWVRYGNHDTFWVSAPSKGHKRMSEYNWKNSAPGMPFRKE